MTSDHTTSTVFPLIDDISVCKSNSYGISNRLDRRRIRFERVAATIRVEVQTKVPYKYNMVVM